MARKPFEVTYRGQKIGLKQLALSKGLSSGLLRDRWKEAGRPDVITDDLLKSASESRHKLSGVTYNGRPVESCESLAKQLGISSGLVSLRIRKYGKTLLPIHLESKKRQFDQKVEPLPIDHSDKSPGWLERKLFPNAGENGFSKSERPRLGVTVDLPVTI